MYKIYLFFYNNRIDRIVFYLFFTDLNQSKKIHNRKIDYAFKVQFCRRRVKSTRSITINIRLIT